MNDPVREGFLRAMHQQLLEFTAASDIVRLEQCLGDPPEAYLVNFDAPCYVRRPGGEIALHHGFQVGIAFPPDYLKVREVQAPSVLQFVSPRNVWHSNIRWPFICIGRIAGGTDAVEILLRVFELATFQRKANPNEFDALNPEACRWTREHWPVEATTRRPLKSKRPAGGQV